MILNGLTLAGLESTGAISATGLHPHAVMHGGGAWPGFHTLRLKVHRHHTNTVQVN